MKINGSSANSINFIEQKKSNTSKSQLENNKNEARGDIFSANSMPSPIHLNSNESMGLLQVALDSIDVLSSKNNDLQKLNEKFSYFTSQEDELKEKFDQISVDMLDVIDNTMFKDSGVFYAEHTLSIGSLEYNFSMLSDETIEDFVLGDSNAVDDFAIHLDSLKSGISTIKEQLEIANFNNVAVLHEHSPLINIDASMLTKKEEPPILSTYDIKQAHNVDLLKSRVDFLLED